MPTSVKDESDEPVREQLGQKYAFYHLDAEIPEEPIKEPVVVKGSVIPGSVLLSTTEYQSGSQDLFARFHFMVPVEDESVFDGEGVLIRIGLVPADRRLAVQPSEGTMLGFMGTVAGIHFFHVHDVREENPFKPAILAKEQPPVNPTEFTEDEDGGGKL